jgi:hypothetical protein
MKSIHQTSKLGCLDTAADFLEAWATTISDTMGVSKPTWRNIHGYPSENSSTPSAIKHSAICCKRAASRQRAAEILSPISKHYP